MNIVSKRAGNNWAGNASGYFVNHDLQGNNTPDELVDAGIERSIESTRYGNGALM